MNTLSHKELTQDDIDMYFFYRHNGVKKAFFLRYFEKLKTARNTVEAFLSVNEEYFELFSEYRYSSIYSFRNQLRKYLQK